MKNINTIDKIFEQTPKKCDEALSQFRIKDSTLITELIEHKRFDDLIKVLYKQGFLTGMQHSREIRDGILSDF